MKRLSAIATVLCGCLMAALGEETLPSCACALEAYDQTFDCSDVDKLKDAASALQQNNCDSRCASAACKSNYYYVQAHNDFCVVGNIPEGIDKSALFYQDSCDECHVIRHSDPDLPTCSRPNCNDSSGSTAYSFLVNNGCLDDCKSNPDCGKHFRILMALYDGCPLGTLSSLAQLGFNDHKDVCASEGCNVADSSTDATQLRCIGDKASLPKATDPNAASSGGSNNNRGAAIGITVVVVLLVVALCVCTIKRKRSKKQEETVKTNGVETNDTEEVRAQDHEVA